jgi:hypothetical protein
MRGCASDVVDRRFTYAAVGLLLLKSEIARGLSSKQAGQGQQGLISPVVSALNLGVSLTHERDRDPQPDWATGVNQRR